MKHTNILFVFFLCVMMTSTLLMGCGNGEPKPKLVQVVNPMMAVSSVEEMESYLDFEIPMLSKDVSDYIVLVIDGYPTMGRIYYTDDATFSIQYGSGDVSGIYGGTLVKTEPVKGVNVSYYTFESLYYALWETGGFTYSLTGGANLETEVASLIP